MTYIEVVDEGKSDDLEGEITNIVTSGSYSITTVSYTHLDVYKRQLY